MVLEGWRNTVRVQSQGDVMYDDEFQLPEALT